MFAELHLASVDKSLIKLLSRLGYGLVAITVGGSNDIVELPIFRKLVITQNSTWKISMHKNFDIVSVIPWNRFVINKFINDERIDLITINDVDKNALPSKPQARVMANEGKALEIVLNPIIRHGEHGLAFLRDIINEYSVIDGLKIVVSQGISKVSDVRNPRDIIELMRVLSNVDAKPFLSDYPSEILVDAVYKRGVCL
ncbi:MAG: RNase P subunit p30 family protein [Vulcanisaeta sp.]|jgi:ribonuclease P/MRP protein subunit RPP1|uniref:RNase P subunit p30 family protein n=1 Tax=Vulcanisaeta sp. TaxID=2020871 RepID=UPI003D0D8E91